MRALYPGFHQDREVEILEGRQVDACGEPLPAGWVKVVFLDGGWGGVPQIMESSRLIVPLHAV